jgi:hypothetical protein
MNGGIGWANAAEMPLRKGSKVRHARWGEGTVVRVDRTGVEDRRADIHFDRSDSTKRIALRTAPLQASADRRPDHRFTTCLGCGETIEV